MKMLRFSLGVMRLDRTKNGLGIRRIAHVVLVFGGEARETQRKT